MYTAVRCYTGAGPLARAMVERQQEIEEALREVPGFVSYNARRAGDGTMSTITVCEERAGTTESTRRVAAWFRERRAGGLMLAAEITQGEMFPKV